MNRRWNSELASRRPRAYAGIPVVALLLVLCAVPAAGQIDAEMGLGGGVAFYQPVDDMAHDSAGFAFIYRLGKPEGLRPTFGFNWYSLDFDAVVGGQRVRLGALRIRPIMGGYGYWVTRDRVSLAATVIAGLAFNSFDTADAARLAYDRNLDELLLRINASPAPAARAEIGVWYDLTSRFGLLGSVGYVAARPRITTTTESGRESRRLRADAVKLQIGLVYGLF
jgi:hypothetical protein